DEDLEPDISGIRPKLQGKGEPFRDFVIAEESARGLPGFYDLVGIESPGLTAAPAIAEYVADLLRG
ncbi:MAG TPA: FAD-dependent oxidoreductase, partial [Thermoanaerobaculia bacterium]